MSSLGDAAQVVTAAAALVALGGGYVQFVLKRSLGFLAEFDVNFAPVARGPAYLVGEIEVSIRNAERAPRE